MMFLRKKSSTPSYIEYKVPLEEAKQENYSYIISTNYRKELEAQFGSFRRDSSDSLESYLLAYTSLSKSQHAIMEPKAISYGYDPVSDKILFSFIHENLPYGKFTLEIPRNTYEDRLFRHKLLSKGLITEAQSAPIYSRKILPKYLSTADMPRPLFEDNYPLGQGEEGKEISWDSFIKSHLFIYGGKGAGKTNITRNILASVFHHSSGSAYEIDLSIADPKPLTKYRNMSRGCNTTLDNALEQLKIAYDIAKHHTTNTAQNMLVIENADLLMPFWIMRESDLEDPNYNKKQEALAWIKKILSVKDTNYLHLILTFSDSNTWKQLEDAVRENGSVARIALGQVGPEFSRDLFDDDNGYFVSPYIEGRGYARLGNDPGQEFQSYLIEDDYLNHVAYRSQLRVR